MDNHTLIATALILSSYPVLYDVISLQPRILFLGLAIAALALFRSGDPLQLSPAAISRSKPQIA